MLIGVMSDTHDNLPKTKQALDLFKERGVEAVIHAGDFVAPFTARLLIGSALPIIGVFGNNDGERQGLKKACDTIYDPPHRFAIGGRTIMLVHEPDELDGADLEGVELVIHGHTHDSRLEEGPPVFLNPGECGGWLRGRSTCALVELSSLEVEFVTLGPQQTVEI